MRGARLAIVVVLATASLPAQARRSAPPGFAEPGDIIAAESAFAHLSSARGLKVAIRATAARDALIFAPSLMRVSDYADGAAATSFPPWHTGQVWMSCDGSVAVTHGASPAGWNVTVWQRQKGGGYKWVLEQGGAQTAASADSDMIAATVADCPPHSAGTSAPAPDHASAPAPDYTSGIAADESLRWATLQGPASRIFTLQIRQDGALHEVLRAIAAPGA